MANSYVQYVGDGATRVFNLTFPYINQDHIQVKVNGSPVSFTFVTSSTVETATAPAAGAVVDVRRVTPTDQQLVEFQNGSVLVAEDLNGSATQEFYIAQEAADTAEAAITYASTGVHDAHGKRLTNLADPVAAQDAVTKGYLEAAYVPALEAIKADAETAQAAAEAAELSATNHATTAQGYATAAGNHATTALGYRNTAQSHADAAAASEVAAAASAAAAAASAGGGVVKVSGGDTTADYLESKVTNGANISITKTGTGGDEGLTIAVTGLADVATSGAYGDLGGKPTLGTAAALDVGVSANNVVQLDGSGKLPAVDGSQLTGVSTAPDLTTDVGILALAVARLDTPTSPMVGGTQVADEFDDSTGIYAAGSSNYTVTGGYVTQTVSASTSAPDANTKLLVSGFGTVGGTTFTDQAGIRTVTTLGAAAYVDGGPFGSTCIDLPSSGSGFHWPDAADIEFGSSSFTIDFWFQPKADPNGLLLFSHWQQAGGGNKSLECYVSNAPGTGNLWLRRSNDGATEYNLYSGTLTWTIGQWYHIAIERSGNTWTLYRDGAVLVQDTQSFALYNSASRWEVGYQNGSPAWVASRFAQFRISNTARYGASAFTSPSAPYSATVTRNDLTVMSTAANAASAPQKIAFVGEWQDMTASATLNTDFTAEVSRDGGTTWSTVALTDYGISPTGGRAVQGVANVSGQPSGTDIRYRVKMLNNKEQKVHGVWRQWR